MLYFPLPVSVELLFSKGRGDECNRNNSGESKYGVQSRVNVVFCLKKGIHAVTKGSRENGRVCLSNFSSRLKREASSSVFSYLPFTSLQKSLSESVAAVTVFWRRLSLFSLVTPTFSVPKSLETIESLLGHL